MEINELARDVFLKANAQNLTYCHWKSNFHLDSALVGDEDLDVLIAPKDFKKLKIILLENNFIEILTPCSPYQKGVYHFYGIDTNTGLIIHFHIFTDLITGNGLIKNFYLPFRELLLDNVIFYKELVKIPTSEMELIIYVFRFLSKQGNLFNLREIIKESKLIFEEFLSLKNSANMQESVLLLKNFCQNDNLVEIYKSTIEFLEEKKFFRIFLLGLKFKKLVKWNRFNVLFYAFAETKTMLTYIWGKLRKKSVVRLVNRAPLVVLVGGPASGKTTLTTSVKKILRPFIDIEYFHVGKPKPIILLGWIRLFLPFFRKIFPNQKSTNVEKRQSVNDKIHFSMLHVLRKLILAYERYRLTRKICGRINNGRLCVCDRYPLSNELMTDGSTFSPEIIKHQKSFIKKFLMKKEASLYSKMIKPDCIFYLKVEPSIALERNKHRKISYKDEDYLRFRHRLLSNIEKAYYKDKNFFILNTQEETVQNCTKKVIEEIFSRC